MSENPKELADEAVALRLIADALYERAKSLAARAGAAMGRGTLYPKLPDGTELAQFTMPADAIQVDIDEDRLLPVVRAEYPTELTQCIRPAFLAAIRKASSEAEAPCFPDGTAIDEGVAVGRATNTAPRIKASPAGRERARDAVASVLDSALIEFARPQIPGETQ